MFKLPDNLPTNTSNINELTDYLEWRCVLVGSISLNEMLKPIALVNDEIDIDGIEDEGDKLLAMQDGILNEFQRRYDFSNKRYPFAVERSGYRLSIDSRHQAYWVYIYLLLCTRLNMSVSSRWENLDGALLFEELSAAIAKNYFGHRAESFVFGTGAIGGFIQKINDLCNVMGEGHGYARRDSKIVNANDDKLDIVVWKSFSDKQFSKLIGFGQCKTGTSWDDGATIELQPADFCKKWFVSSTVVDPVKMFFCTQYFPLDSYSKAINAGVVFDRFRILDFLPGLDKQLASKIERWCKAAIKGISKPTVSLKKTTRNLVSASATVKKKIAKKDATATNGLPSKKKISKERM
ncbi:MAG: hypothetical protein V4649_02510 [Bacteroidota bacterium]